MSWTDALGHTIDLQRPPRRIVSLVPSITEALFAFGLGKRIVGVTKFCVEPKDEVTDVPKVGGTKNLDATAVKKLKPELVVANAEENEKADIESLVAEGLPVFVTYPRTVAHATAMMRTLAEMTDTVDVASPIVAGIEAEAALARAANKENRRRRVFCPIWRNPWMTIGPDTYMHDFLSNCGLDNVYGDSNERYPEIALEDAAERQPEIVILPDEPYRFSRRHVPEVTEGIPAVGESRIYLVDGKDICWHGPRIAGALRRVREAVSADASL